MRIIGLHDSCFPHQLSLSLGGENCQEAPKLIQWDRDTWVYNPTTVFTDMHLKDAVGHAGRNIVLLVEPPSLSLTHYEMVHALSNHFDVILSPWGGAADWLGAEFVHYPLGGSWISLEHWGFHHDKLYETSIIVSEKTGALGHRMRHNVVDALGLKYDLHVKGRWIKQMDSKVGALAPYQYSIVIESVAARGYFSEKLIDCLSVGTIPLYWGAPDIEEYFPGLPTWRTINELDALLALPPKVDEGVQRMWLQYARGYRCAEDWIVSNIEGVFDER